MQTLHPKVKVPAVVGTCIAIALAVLAAVGTVPAAAPYAAIAVTLLNTVAGYFTYAP